MKSTLRTIWKTFGLRIAIGIMFTLLTINLPAQTAQNPPPPNNGNSPGSSNTPVGGGAPIGGGLFILLGMGAVYGGRKLYHLRNENENENE